MNRRTFLLSGVSVFTCFATSQRIAQAKMTNQPSIQLTDREKALAKRIGFDEAVLLIIKATTQENLDPLKKYNFDTYSPGATDIPGISVIAEKSKIGLYLQSIRSQLPSGYCTAIVRNYGDGGSVLPDSIAVIRSIDRYDLLRIRDTDGANYGVSTEDLIAKLKNWEKKSSFELEWIGADLVGLKFRALPESICAFAEEVYELCPDSVEQGVSLQYDAQDDQEVYSQANRLCPETVFKATHDQDTRQGIALLAYDMQKTNQLVLWWD